MINVIPNSSYQKLKLEKASVHESVNRAKVKARSCSLIPTLQNVNIFVFQESLGMRLTIMHLFVNYMCVPPGEKVGSGDKTNYYFWI